MNIMVDSINSDMSAQITSALAIKFGLARVDRTFADGTHSTPWIIDTAPNSSHEYIEFCARGLAPDLVIYIHSNLPNDAARRDLLEIFYEGIIVSITDGSPRIFDKIDNIVAQELADLKK